MIYEFRNYKFDSYCTMFDTEIGLGVSQPTDYDIFHIKRFLYDNPNRNKIMIDVGAHIGLFSIIYSQFFDKIYAFEPNKKSFEYLLKNIELNKCKNIVAQNLGVSSFLTSGSLVSTATRNKDNSGAWKLCEGNDIDCIKLDDHFTYADFIKTDTEGNDGDVLISAYNILKNSGPFIQIEVPPNDSFLSGLGYKCVDSLHDSYFER